VSRKRVRIVAARINAPRGKGREEGRAEKRAEGEIDSIGGASGQTSASIEKNVQDVRHAVIDLDSLTHSPPMRKPFYFFELPPSRGPS